MNVIIKISSRIIYYPVLYIIISQIIYVIIKSGLGSFSILIVKGQNY